MDDPLPASLLRQFGHCPLLKIFHAVFYHHLHLATGQIDLNHLTELAIGHYVGKGLAELLAECPALEYLAIAGFQYSEVSVEGISKTLKAEISHAQLSTLHIGFIKEDFDDRAMEGVSLPGLQSLTLRAIPSIGDFLHPNQTRHGEFIVTLQAMLRRSNCNLQSLSLIRVQEEAAIALISGCPSISHLSCTETDISETLLAQLTLTEDSRVAPNLITLGMGSATVANSFLENCKAFEESCCRLVESRVYSTRLESAVIGDASQGLRRFLLRPLRPRDHPNLRDSTERIQSRLQSLGLKEVVVSVDFKWFNETMLDD
ncbi:hypothetical protein BT96DRAFT_995774 [Gymnopus androsaceus JB14]|uniref:F-box domain-containing protein n=1 Tax=Gymnopus androsaceus JB14 TaxID=1447944 RepID=A0A6A4HG26_9AGAR|nr:hypothetical protein BT96DRAFT_995774 [Gymnopus androsaceus JB14]